MNGSPGRRLAWTGGALLALAVLYAPSRLFAYYIADDDNAHTHEVMTKQALDLYLHYTQGAPTIIRQEISDNWSHIQTGVGDPDRRDDIYSNKGAGGALTRINHFWESHTDLASPVKFRLLYDIAGGIGMSSSGLYPNAFQAAQTYWTRGLGYYQAGNKSEAYRHLGMVAHLLGDLTIPWKNQGNSVRLLNETTIGRDHDDFESWMSDNEPDGVSRPQILHPQESNYAVLYLAERGSLEAQGPLLPPAGLGITEFDDRFLWLFLRTSAIAGCMASEGREASFSDPIDPRVAGWVNDEISELYDLRSINPGIYPDSNSNIQNTPVQTLDFIRSHSYIPGIRTQAALFALWEEAVSIPLVVVTVHQIKEIGDDTVLGVLGMDDYGKPDFYAGMIMGPNLGRMRAGQNADGYAPHLVDYDLTVRNINDGNYPANVTRKSAYTDVKDGGTEDATDVYPNFRFGQSYRIPAGGYVSGVDFVRATLSIWENDETGSIVEKPYESDDPADIGLGTGVPLPITIDLAKCQAGASDAVRVGASSYYPAGSLITWTGSGDNSNDVRVVFSVRLGSYGFVTNTNDAGANSLRGVIAQKPAVIRFDPVLLNNQTINLTTGAVPVPVAPVSITGKGVSNKVRITADQPTRIGPPAP